MLNQIKYTRAQVQVLVTAAILVALLVLFTIYTNESCNQHGCNAAGEAAPTQQQAYQRELDESTPTQRLGLEQAQQEENANIPTPSE